MKIPEHWRKLLPLLGQRAGVRASVSFNLISGVGGGFWRGKHFRLVTSAATALATILELTLQRFERADGKAIALFMRSEEHTSELQSLTNLVCRLLLEKKKKKIAVHKRV